MLYYVIVLKSSDGHKKTCINLPPAISNFCRAMLAASAALAVMRCLSVCMSVCHVRTFCQNGNG